MDKQADVSGQVYGALVAVLRLFVFLALALGLLLLVRIVYKFFGTLESAPGYDLVLSLTDSVADPFSSLGEIETPYQGVFDVAGTAALLVAMVVEFLISGLKSSLAKRSERALIQQIAAKVRAADAQRVPEDEPALKE